jgi:NADH-quinone oxidoreductase subunit I
LSTDDRFEDLLLHKQDLAKPNEYYHQLHPADAQESDGVLAAEKAKAEAKARAAAEAKAAADAKAKAAIAPATAQATPSAAPVK